MQNVLLTHEQNNYNNHVLQKVTYFISRDVIANVCGIQLEDGYGGLRVDNVHGDIGTYLQKNAPKDGIKQRVHRVQLSNEYITDVANMFVLKEKCRQYEIPRVNAQNDDDRQPRRANVARYAVDEMYDDGRFV